MLRILVVDDDVDISELIALILKREQMEVVVKNDSVDALELLKKEHFDLILLDIMMPNLSGTELCGKIRDLVSSPIIFISAKNQLIDKMLGYEIGGDDYITKPFDNNELVLKVKSHLRISNRINKQNKKDLIKIGDITLNTSSFEVRKNDEKVDISTREFELLRYLMENAGQALSKEQIFSSVWGSEYGDMGTVAVNIKSLRDKIDLEGKYIITIWGYGYKFIKESDYA
ncbi:MAG: response regulator transcription factor [Bacilli bacterium]|nr:response regulator transcription factor [Bacilli bacterium]